MFDQLALLLYYLQKFAIPVAISQSIIIFSVLLICVWLAPHMKHRKIRYDRPEVTISPSTMTFSPQVVSEFRKSLFTGRYSQQALYFLTSFYNLLHFHSSITPILAQRWVASLSVYFLKRWSVSDTQ